MLEIGNYDFFTPDNYSLTSLIQSGILKLIDSEETKKELLRLLKIYESIDNIQKNFLQTQDEGYFPVLLSKVDMEKFKAVDIDFFYGLQMKNYCAYNLNETSIHFQSKKQVEKLIIVIEKDLSQEK